ncbi:MAG: FtsK/SpoIIIE domain-containing protein, partial [Mycobacteriales bacterium]
ALVAARSAATRDRLAAPPGQDLLVVLDGAAALRALPGLAAVLREGPSVGVHLLCLDEHEQLLPEECRAVVTCGPSGRAEVRRTGQEPQRHVRRDGVSARWAEQVARSLAPLQEPAAEEGRTALPATTRLLDLLGMPEPTGAAVAARWGRSTEAVLGVDVDGPFVVDLQRDGPHALVAGTTGSGKSELLQTLVASLAVANRPDAMTFVLVDYKGGAAFRDCARLPHVVGLVTDLDGHLVARALASLSAELTHREQLLAAAGASDLEGYWRAGSPRGPLARLVIVVDEFASLAEELPDFVPGLVGVAQRGRSLGLHLVLATQRPSGVVSPEIRANAALRIALRVTDAAESLDVLDAPDAATVSRGTPGRAYVRTGHASLSCLQTARVGGRRPGTGAPGRVRAWPLPWTEVGDPPPASPKEPSLQEQTDLQVLVAAVADAARELGLPPSRSPWLPPLPTLLPLDRVRRPAAPQEGLPPIVYGAEDRPAEQACRPAALDLERGGHLLVVGTARSGRTTLLRTLAGSLAAGVSPADAHLYALDCGNGALLPVADLPHCGAVVTRAETERAGRLLARLAAEVGRRQDLLAAHGFTDLAEQRVSGQDPLPYLVLLLDRWEGFTAAFDEVDAGRMTETLLRLLREGPGAGLRVVVTGDRSALLGKLTGAIEDVLCLRLADRSDYALAGLSPRLLPETVPSGRGFRSGCGLEVQVALLTDDPSGGAQAAALVGLGHGWPPAPAPFRVDVLPTRVDRAAATALPGAPRTGPLWAEVGVGGDELSRLGVDLSLAGPGFTIGGPRRSGRSTALTVLGESLLAGGAALWVLAPRPSPVRGLAGRPGVLHVVTDAHAEAADLEAVIENAAGPLAVLVDDAELLLTHPVGDVLHRLLRSSADRGRCVVLAGSSDELAAAFHGWTAEARKSRSGLLLTPTSHLHGELLGVRLARSAAFAGPPGRGLLVQAGQVQQVQVPLPT